MTTAYYDTFHLPRHLSDNQAELVMLNVKHFFPKLAEALGRLPTQREADMLFDAVVKWAEMPSAPGTKLQ